MVGAEASTPRSVKANVRKSAQRRASLAAGARALSTSLAQQLRRHSGDAYAASQRLLAGAASCQSAPLIGKDDKYKENEL